MRGWMGGCERKREGGREREMEKDIKSVREALSDCV